MFKNIAKVDVHRKTRIFLKKNTFYSIEGGDLSRVEGRSVKPYWTLLFSDILLFAKVSRDRVLFITEEPIPLANIIDSFFNIRKKRKFNFLYNCLVLTADTLIS